MYESNKFKHTIQIYIHDNAIIYKLHYTNHTQVEKNDKRNEN